MHLSRREWLAAGLTAPFALAQGQAGPADVHQQLLERAAKLQAERRARFAAVKTPADLEALQKDLRQKFLDLLDGLPTAEGPPPARIVGQIDAGDYRIDKLVFESFPAYFVTALLYRPKKIDGKAPGIISPCGHSGVGKAAGSYQILHVNLVKRGCIVLTYDPVGQGERSQFWNAAQGRSKYNLTCGEHCVLGNPLYLLGTSLARYRIWDGMRAIDYLLTLPEVDKDRIGCVGNSGGGTLTAYIAALDPRVRAAITSCYITTLPRRMANRTQQDPDSDPEQDIAGFVSAGIDHAGLLALRAPRPTLVNSAILDFFPIEGARESYAEAKKLFEAGGAGERISMVEANERHGLTLPCGKAPTPSSTAGCSTARKAEARRSPSSRARPRSCWSALRDRSMSPSSRDTCCRWRWSISRSGRRGRGWPWRTCCSRRRARPTPISIQSFRPRSRAWCCSSCRATRGRAGTRSSRRWAMLMR